ncbi:MAG: chemotaxis protein CheB [Myxococcota bacterium]
MSPVRVLIVDDSPIACSALERVLSRDPIFEVVGTAHTADSAFQLATQCAPDIATVDLSMPGRPGVDLIADLMHARPMPVVVVTADAHQPDAFEALRSGALDVVAKPDVFGASGGQEFRDKLRRLASVPVIRRVAPARRVTPAAPSVSPVAPSLVVVGASAGGPAAIAELLKELGESFVLPMLIVQHLSSSFAEGFVRFLRNHTRRGVSLCEREMELRKKQIVVAAPGYHMVFVGRMTVAPGDGAPEHNNRPSVSVTMRSGASRLGPACAGVVLSGMGADGADGLLAIKRAGGLTFSEAGAAVDGMPRAARELGASRFDLPIEAIAERLLASRAAAD